MYLFSRAVYARHNQTQTTFKLPTKLYNFNLPYDVYIV